MNKLNVLLSLFILLISSCTQDEIAVLPVNEVLPKSNSFTEESISFALVGSLDLGPTGAAEISEYDPSTKKLFVVNNTNNKNRIDVLNLTNPSMPVLLTSIAVAPFGGLVNSVSVSNGKVAAGIEASDKVSPGKVVVFNTSTYQVIKEIIVGSLPDMVTFTPDGLYILSANEGEPNLNYTIDPPGTISIIDINQNYSVTTLGFEKFKFNLYQKIEKGFRIFGPKADITNDVEPEYITVSSNSRTAWVTLQENNAIAKINIRSKTITDIYPLGFKNYQLAANPIDPSDQNSGAVFSNFEVKGMYEPDGIAVYDYHGEPFLFTANEGDSREYNTYVENVRYGSSAYKVDPISLPQGAFLKANNLLGRLNVSLALGDKDKDGDFDEIYTHGARSFSIWSGATGARVFDSRNDLDLRAVAAGKYPEARSDDKGTEPEAVILGKIGETNLLFVGMERAHAVAIYNINDPFKPEFIQWLNTAEGPEGLVFVPSDKSPNGKNLLIVSCEVEGVIMIFSSSVAGSTF